MGELGRRGENGGGRKGGARENGEGGRKGEGEGRKGGGRRENGTPLYLPSTKSVNTPFLLF